MIWITLPKEDNRGVCVGGGDIDDHESVLILEKPQKPPFCKMARKYLLASKQIGSIIIMLWLLQIILSSFLCLFRSNSQLDQGLLSEDWMNSRAYREKFL